MSDVANLILLSHIFYGHAARCHLKSNKFYDKSIRIRIVQEKLLRFCFIIIIYLKIYVVK